MLETLKKIGIPTAIATAISLLFVIVPVLFEVDERYAKQSALESEVRRLEAANSKLEQRNNDLQAELAQNAGFQQAMIGFIAQGRIPTAPAPVFRPAAPPPPPAAVDLDNIPASNAGSSTPPQREPVIVGSPAPAPLAASVPVETPPKNWRELSEGVYRQQQRLAIER
jgi:FtsZ-binding cell division protein ZapB